MFTFLCVDAFLPSCTWHSTQVRFNLNSLSHRSTNCKVSSASCPVLANTKRASHPAFFSLYAIYAEVFPPEKLHTTGTSCFLVRSRGGSSKGLFIVVLCLVPIFIATISPSASRWNWSAKGSWQA